MEISYIQKASSERQHVFGGFHFFYSLNDYVPPETSKDILQRYESEITQVQQRIPQAKKAFNSLSTDVKAELTAWFGEYSYDALSRMKIIPNLPTTPLIGKDRFYTQFGTDLLKGYGLIE